MAGLGRLPESKLTLEFIEKCIDLDLDLEISTSLLNLNSEATNCESDVVPNY